ncbi:MAG: hypothetical protein CL946_05585 [Ectothiorhodospiraceae bacterium]|nr:hypothetical protein [Ectothiorhodospiraceae bacterium]
MKYQFFVLLLALCVINVMQSISQRHEDGNRRAVYLYYSFKQTYPAASIEYMIGELCINTSGIVGRRYLLLESFDMTATQAKVGWSIDRLTDSSITRMFLINDGDVVSYHDNFVTYLHSDTSEWANIQDTVAFFIEIVDAKTHDVLQLLDIRGVLPYSRQVEGQYRFINHDSGSETVSDENPRITKYEVDIPDTPRAVRLRIRPHFGPTTSDGMSRYNIERLDIHYLDRPFSKTDKY